MCHRVGVTQARSQERCVPAGECHSAGVSRATQAVRAQLTLQSPGAAPDVVFVSPEPFHIPRASLSAMCSKNCRASQKMLFSSTVFDGKNVYLKTHLHILGLKLSRRFSSFKWAEILSFIYTLTVCQGLPWELHNPECYLW